jgi:hypothetical protein
MGRCRERAQVLWGAAMLALAAVSAISVRELITSGLQRSLPIFASVEQGWPRSVWLALIVTLLALSSTVAYRFARRANCDRPIVAWRRNPARYYHEWRATSLALVAAISMKFIAEIASLFHEWMSNSTGFALSLGDLITSWFQPLTILWFWAHAMADSAVASMRRRPRNCLPRLCHRDDSC